jgi:Tfp pilus assembly protein PilF
LQFLRAPFVLDLLLFIATLILYSPALNHAFVNYDDPAYVISNPHVLQGLSLQSMGWALTATFEGNWFPVTRISHMTDVQLFGTNPLGHHMVNVILHAFNVVLLFWVLRGATRQLARSALVALLFAVHPLNVECVAWISERKSLLAMLFFLLTLLAYEWYSSHRNVGRYLAVSALFALGLMAKPMIVTLPVLLLLWDYWPLRRFGSEPSRGETPFELFAEKLPLFALSAASSAITIYAQRAGGALGNMQLLPLRLRLENAIWSYTAYIGKGIWPTRLAVFYPHPEGSLSLAKILIATLLLVIITVLAWLNRARVPYLFTGWFWFAIAMFPMIGIVQVGRQAMADRYAYLPFIGLFLIAVWGAADLFRRLQLPMSAEAVIATAVIVALSTVAFFQIRYWRDSYTLFSHALAVTTHNGIAEDNLGVALMEMGRPDLALPHFEAAARYIPQLSTAHYNLGVLAQQSNRAETARFEYELALRYSADPDEIAQAHSNLGLLLLDVDPQSALVQFTAALQINPDKTNSLLGRGMAEYRLGNLDAAINDLTRASRTPIPLAYYWLGRALEDKGQTPAAINAYQVALHLAPALADAQQRLDGLSRSSNRTSHF